MQVTTSNTEKLSITLPANMAEMIRNKVQSGSYTSNSELIREALRLWQGEEELREQKRMALQEKLQEALDDPRPSIPADEVFSMLRQHASQS